MILSPETKAIFPFLPHEAISDAIRDYCQCYRLKENTKALCEAIVLAVNNCESVCGTFVRFIGFVCVCV